MLLTPTWWGLHGQRFSQLTPVRCQPTPNTAGHGIHPPHHRMAPGTPSMGGITGWHHCHMGGITAHHPTAQGGIAASVSALTSLPIQATAEGSVWWGAKLWHSAQGAEQPTPLANPCLEGHPPRHSRQLNLLFQPAREPPHIAKSRSRLPGARPGAAFYTSPAGDGPCIQRHLITGLVPNWFLAGFGIGDTGWAGG